MGSPMPGLCFSPIGKHVRPSGRSGSGLIPASLPVVETFGNEWASPQSVAFTMNPTLEFLIVSLRSSHT
jgi:hypothetical protein